MQGSPTPSPTPAVPPPAQPTRPREESPKSDESLRVMASRLDHLIQLVGEISLHQAILERAARENSLGSQTVRNVIDIKSKLTQDLQDAALSLRMIPIENLFQKIERVIRETATNLKKNVVVKRIGDEVTLDKLVVDRMLDPLIHIARNAMDHGIETSEERLAAGKSDKGQVLLTAENTTGGVTLTFADDGRGIDPERVFIRAVEKGLVASDAKLSDAAKQMLIFLPGLSTAEKVSDVSGRGIGMDVVSDVVAKLGGHLELTSTLGQGTRIAMTLPTNLSILNALVIRVEGCQYAIPNQELSEVVNLRELDVQDVEAGRNQVFSLRGRVVPVQSMSTFLRHHLDSTTASATASAQATIGNPSATPIDRLAPKPGLVVRFRDDLLAFSVDHVVGQQQIFVRPVIDSLNQVRVFGGSTILSDGEPSMILNLTEMARTYFENL